MRSAFAFVESRSSPVSAMGLVVVLAFALVAATASLATGLTFPPLPSLLLPTAAVAAFDLACRFAPQTTITDAVRTMVYGVLYLAMTCWCGILAAYATQRLALPLQDDLFDAWDRAMGLNWLELVHWVDRHSLVNEVLAVAYHSMPGQIALPVVVLALANRVDHVRRYLLSFALGLMITTIVAALAPVLSHIALIDRSSFASLKFSGATPLEHLAQLRLPGPVQLNGNLGGLLGFPSFHATVAILIPLVLRGYPRIFLPLLLLDATMFCSAISEGAHYGSDVIAGACVALLAYVLAGRSVGRASMPVMKPPPSIAHAQGPALPMA